MTQSEEILTALKSGRALTPIDALEDFGCFRLGARIWDLKKDGHNIVKERGESFDGMKKKYFAKYRLIPKEDLFK